MLGPMLHRREDPWGESKGVTPAITATARLLQTLGAAVVAAILASPWRAEAQDDEQYAAPTSGHDRPDGTGSRDSASPTAPASDASAPPPKSGAFADVALHGTGFAAAEEVSAASGMIDQAPANSAPAAVFPTLASEDALETADAFEVDAEPVLAPSARVLRNWSWSRSLETDAASLSGSFVRGHVNLVTQVPFGLGFQSITISAPDSGPSAIRSWYVLKTLGSVFRFTGGEEEAEDRPNSAPTGITVSGALSVGETVAMGGTIGAAYDPAGVVVASLATLDADAGDSFTYTLISATDHNGAVVGDIPFEINGATVRVKAGATLDYEVAQSYNLVIKTTDAHGATYLKTVQIAVQDYVGAYTAGNGGEVIAGTSEKDVITGGAGVDTVTYASAAAGVTVTLGDRAPVSFGEKQVVTTTADFVWSVAAADVDGDGDIDLLSASANDDTIAWYENDGAGGFTERVVTTSANGASDVTTADMDGDGDIDLLSAWQHDDTIAWYENDGAGGFTERVVTTTADGAKSVAAADVDGDGDIDLMSASIVDDTIAWYENDGAGGFTKRVVTTTADGAKSVAAADLDGDGDIDLMSASQHDDTIAWYENDGSEVFTKQVVTTTADGARLVAAADVDGDGDIDLMSASHNDDTIAWYENDGAGNFAKHVVTTSADYALSVAAADVDGDGDIDLLSASANDDTIAWYENDGVGGFAEHVVTTTADGPHSVAAADLDGDGDLDLVSASAYDDTVAWYENLQTSPDADTLTNIENVVGSSFADRLTGNSADNVLDGGAGDDILTGGAGADRFLFTTSGYGADVVTDFEDGLDLIVIAAATGVTGFGQIAAIQAGAHVDLTFGGGTVRLEDTALADIDASNFVFL